MKYLPFEHIIFRTSLSEQEVRAKLSDFTEARKSRFFNTPTKDYEGFINGNSFKINRIIKGRNSFAPQINGTIRANAAGTQIEVKMKLQEYVLAFLIGWCFLASLFLMAIFTMEDKTAMDFLLPVLMLLFVYALTMIGFKIESKKSREYLKKNFEAKIISDSSTNP